MDIKTKWSITKTAREAWDAMLLDCKNAKTSIDLEMYIFSDDESTDPFIEVFCSKAKSGVHVSLLLDYWGSRDFKDSMREQKLISSGVSIFYHNPIPYWRLNKFLKFFSRRDHRKIILIDKTIAHIGGVNIRSDMSLWKDVNIRLIGPVVGQVEDYFRRSYESVKKTKRVTGYSRYDFVDDFKIIGSAPKIRQRYFLRNLVRQFKQARSRIYIQTPYLVPPPSIIRSLSKAARGGIDVKIMVPRNSDSAFLDKASRVYFTHFLKAGINIYEYLDGMLHSKVCIIDDNWASIGSSNFDNLSLFDDYEANIASTNSTFVSDLAKLYMDDLGVSQKVDLKIWKSRPFIEKIKENITIPIHAFL